MTRSTTFELRRVRYIPKQLSPGVLYVSEEFDAAVHLCACGCGSKVSTPLGPTEWTVEDTGGGPSLCPSVGNWQLPCQSHYWITKGEVVWSGKWTPAQIAAGRRAEEGRRRAYYDALDAKRGRKRSGPVRAFWQWLKGLLTGK